MIEPRRVRRRTQPIFLITLAIELLDRIMSRTLISLGAVMLFALPGGAVACACGCGIFNVGLPGLPSSLNATRITLQDSYMDQDETQHGSGTVSGDLNPDKQIKTSFYSLDLQHRFNRDWSAMFMIPYWDRTFVTDANGTPGVTDVSQGVAPQLQTANARVLSDIRLLGMYTGFSPDMSSGVLFGVKLPTGSFHTGTRNAQSDPIMDRDTQPGTGTTDSLLGGYTLGNGDNWGWFVQGLWRHALNTREDYKPGDSVNLVGGIHFDQIEDRTHLVPLLQMNLQWRGHDTGGGDAQFGNANSGYTNLYAAPGVQINFSGHWQAYALVYVPVYRHANGYQEVAHYLGTLGFSYQF